VVENFIVDSGSLDASSECGSLDSDKERCEKEELYVPERSIWVDLCCTNPIEYSQ
jgi:hypothetical protein